MRANTGSALPLIIGFKAFKAATLTLAGIALLATRHADPVDLVLRIALAAHLPLTSALLDRALTLALGLTVRKQIALGITALGYAVLMLGVCLLACIVPTRRALQVQPTEALRADR